ncbi:response regulator transcription factor [Metapseudomonas boanensis]|uniref:Response regulator transcription factor n=1 Tax=Metapseudomonas boanensis TaxID=2822138 RepID=A0ABS5XQB6_9GAMM|nr:response regulator transcription factor [Pseudomonas boanensis]MBT8769296.1 response regulator transcription factor [Pseudomonas boanensis]
MCKVLLIDDQPMSRLAVSVLLEQEGIEVVGEADNGVSGISLARSLEPELVILDISLPKLDGLEVLTRLRQSLGECKLLVLTALPASLYASRCLKAGANGFLSKQEGLENMRMAIKSVISGYSLFPGEAHASRSQQLHREPGTGLDDLSDRELAVLRKLANGKNNKEIAEQLFISHKTVSTYKSRLMEKLNTRRLVDLIDFARQNELCA